MTASKKKKRESTWTAFSRKPRVDQRTQCRAKAAREREKNDFEWFESPAKKEDKKEVPGMAKIPTRD